MKFSNILADLSSMKSKLTLWAICDSGSNDDDGDSSVGDETHKPPANGN